MLKAQSWGDDMLTILLMVGIAGMLFGVAAYVIPQLKVIVEFEQEKLDIINAAHVIRACLLQEGAVDAAALDAAKDIESLCRLDAIAVNAKITDLQTDAVWMLDFVEGKTGPNHLLNINIKQGEDIRPGRLHVQAEA